MTPNPTIPSKIHGNRIIPVIEYAVPFKIAGIYCRLIPLSRGQYCIVWESDYAWLMQWRWWAAWSQSSRCFYAVRDESRKRVFMHQALLGVGADHKNRVSLDNRRDNLRAATKRQNNCNRGPMVKNKTGYKGVSLASRCRNVWIACVEKDCIGRFGSPQDAARAYDREAFKRFGEFAYLNFPKEINDAN